MTAADHLRLRPAARGPLGLFAIWVLWAAVMIVFGIRAGEALMTDPDDFMRLLQVRDWMAGQSWFDVTQYRINPPEGGSMHWSRLLDVPIAALIGLASLVLPQQMAEYVVLITWPLLLLGVLMLIVYHIVRSLADQQVALLAAFLMPTFPLIVRQFMPGRIDHHSWQILMAAIALLALFDRKPKRGALVMALALSLWMHISIEGLPYAVMFGGLLALTYVFPMATMDRPSDTRVIPFVMGLSIFSTGLFAATQPFANMPVPHCDAVSWPLLTVLAFVALGLGTGVSIFKPSRPIAKSLLLGSVGVAASGMFMWLSDTCFLDPFGNLTPVVREYWHATISEGLPITGQTPAIISLLLFVPAIFMVWIVMMLRSEKDPVRKRRWLLLAMLVLASTLLSFQVQRTAGVAELFALPGIAALTAMAVSCITRSSQMLVRVAGTVGVIVLLSPMAAFIGGGALFARADQPVGTIAAESKRTCDIAELNKLPRGQIWTTMGVGPAILYHTPHSVFVSGYHRNYKAMDRLIATMLGSVDDARKTLIDAKVDYVVFCPSHFEAQSYVRTARSGFAASLLLEKQPDWLRPVSSFTGSEMRVYRFDAKLARHDDTT